MYRRGQYAKILNIRGILSNDQIFDEVDINYPLFNGNIIYIINQTK